jgi:NAD(P)-dependent dehydrogenase (short-subunit alcohol dehydrogenase family)
MTVKTRRGRILVTGGTSGLGLETTRILLSQGYEVFATGRVNKEKSLSNSKYYFVQVDFSDLRGVVEVTKKLMTQTEGFDIIINNAGVLAPHGFTATKDGFEYSFQVNFLSHLLLDSVILRMNENRKQLVLVSVTSPVYKYANDEFYLPQEKGYRSFRSYILSKCCMLLVGNFLMSEYPGYNVKAFGFNPGVFSSGIYRTQRQWFHGLYHLGAPVLRPASKVAIKLISTVNQDNPVAGVLYNRHNSYKTLERVYTTKAREFLKKCYDTISPFMD